MGTMMIHCLEWLLLNKLTAQPLEVLHDRLTLAGMADERLHLLTWPLAYDIHVGGSNHTSCNGRYVPVESLMCLCNQEVMFNKTTHMVVYRLVEEVPFWQIVEIEVVGFDNYLMHVRYISLSSDLTAGSAWLDPHSNKIDGTSIRFHFNGLAEIIVSDTSSRVNAVDTVQIFCEVKLGCLLGYAKSGPARGVFWMQQ